MTKVVHCKKEKYDVYIGRPSKWGNPFSHLDGTLAQFKVATRDEAISAYAEWIKTQPRLLLDLPELKDKTLACWCKPKACHGDVLARLADNDNLCVFCGNDMVYIENVNCPSLVHKACPDCKYKEDSCCGLFVKELCKKHSQTVLD